MPNLKLEIALALLALLTILWVISLAGRIQTLRALISGATDEELRQLKYAAEGLGTNDVTVSALGPKLREALRVGDLPWFQPGLTHKGIALIRRIEREEEKRSKKRWGLLSIS